MQRVIGEGRGTGLAVVLKLGRHWGEVLVVAGTLGEVIGDVRHNVGERGSGVLWCNRLDCAACRREGPAGWSLWGY